MTKLHHPGSPRLTGNNVPPVADDGSDEWRVGSVAYETAVDGLIEAHSWNFATLVATLVRAGASPDDMFTDAYNKPVASLALVWVRANDVPVDYKIIGGQICINASGPGRHLQICEAARSRIVAAHVHRLRARIATMAGIYRGLNEDISAAQSMENRSLQMLQDARTRTDQEQGKRALFNSRLRDARRVRRPWSNTPRDWGGTEHAELMRHGHYRCTTRFLIR
jgi:hypothetical protein